MNKDNSLLVRTKKFSYPLFAAAFGLTPFVSSVAMVFFLLAHVSIPKTIDWSKLKVVSVIVVPYLIFLYSATYSYDSYEALKYLMRTSPIIILPALIAVNRNFLENLRQLVVLFYIYGLIVSCVLTIIIGSYFYWATGEIQALLYYDLAEYLSLHPTYYSLYLIVGLIFLLFSGIEIKRLKIITLLLFTVTLILLQTRVAYLVLGILLIIKIFGSSRKAMIYWGAFLAILIIVILFLMPANFTKNKQIFPESEDYSVLIGTNSEDGITQRFWLWGTALEQIKEHRFSGFGLKSQQALFKWKVHKQILENENDPAYDKAALQVASLNLHNQYLQILYEAGILGLSIFVLSILLALRAGIKLKNKLFIFIYVTFLIFLFTENLLDRQMGIYFYSFIIPFFLLFSND